MANFLNNLKKNHNNIHSLLISLLLAIWYNGISSIINLWFPDRGFYISIFMLVIPLVIFLLDDGNLDELYKSPSTDYAIISSANDSTKKEKFDNKPSIKN